MDDVQDKLLFTPGPLTTSPTVKEAMLHDLGSRDEAFIALIQTLREQLLAVAGVSQEAGYETVLMQGSGTFGIEATIGSTVPPEGVLLVVVNGAYGERMVRMAEVLRIPTVVLRYPEDAVPDVDEVGSTLARRRQGSSIQYRTSVR